MATMAYYPNGPSTPNQNQVEAKFDLSIALTLSTWTALTLAVQNSWGGPLSSEKRDWFAGAVSELLNATPDADIEYLEEFLLQVMNDEFEVNVEDDSAHEIAIKILSLRKSVLEGNFEEVDQMMANWQEKQRRGQNGLATQVVQQQDEDQDTDWDEDDISGDSEGDMDLRMSEAPKVAQQRAKVPPPETDEEGFTKVVRKKPR